MDSADPVRAAVSKQGAILGAHEQALQVLDTRCQAIGETQARILASLQEIQSALSPPPGPSSASPAPVAEPPQSSPAPTPSGSVFRDAAFPEPEPYSGERGRCTAFLLKCSLAFTHSPRSFTSESARVAYLVAKLQGKALLWAEAYLSAHPLPTCSFDDFLCEFKKTFTHPVSEGSSDERLLGLQQGSRSVAEFIIDFRTAAAEANWPDHALRGVFRRALNDELKDQLASRDEPKSFEDLVSLSLRIDNRLREREAEKNQKHRKPAPRTFSLPPPSRPVSTSAPVSVETDAAPEPMLIGRSRLTPEERERRLRSGACFYCGSVEHRLAQCSVRPKGSARR